MSLPFHRGNGNNMNNNRNNNYNRDNHVKEVNRNMMEQDNDRHWGELGEQVELLKSVCI